MKSLPLSSERVLATIIKLSQSLGRPPLNRELMFALSTRSVAAVSKALDRLELRKAITRNPLKIVRGDE